MLPNHSWSRSNVVFYSILLLSFVIAAVLQPGSSAGATMPNTPIPPPSIYQRLPRITSTTGLANVAAKPTNVPDLDVRYIGRTPRYKWCWVGVQTCTGVKLWPSAGETVTFSGYIANRGSVATGAFGYAWYIDGVLKSQATHTGLAAGADAVVSFTWAWATGAHTVKLVLDPSNVIAEVTERNNTVEDRTNALSLGIYVEQAVYDYFNANIWQANWDSNTNTIDGDSFDDWMQQQVQVWNAMFAAARYPLTPNGITDRIRLDKVVRVANGALRCDTNNPATSVLTPVAPFDIGIDFEVDLVWGLLSESVGVNSSAQCQQHGFGPFYSDPAYRYTWHTEAGLLHELSHARYLTDLYGLDIVPEQRRLAAAVTTSATTLPLTTDPTTSLAYSPTLDPAFPIIDGEIASCPRVSGNSLINCTRGTRGTTARSHAQNALVFGEPLRLVDGYGNAMIGSASIPLQDNYTLFRDMYWDQDLMAGGEVLHLDANNVPHPLYNEHSAYAWNRIALQRPTLGNWNAPGNLGIFLNDIPRTSNIIQVRYADGSPVVSAIISVYRAKRRCYPLERNSAGTLTKEACVWYGKVYDEPADFLVRTDAQGKANLGAYPFGQNNDGTRAIIHTFSWSNGVLALKIRARDKIGVEFLEVVRFNLEYWRGNTQQATYPITFSHYTPAPLLRDTFLPIIASEPQSASAQSGEASDASAAYPPPPTPAPYPAP